MVTKIFVCKSEVQCFVIEPLIDRRQRYVVCCAQTQWIYRVIVENRISKLDYARTSLKDL